MDRTKLIANIASCIDSCQRCPLYKDTNKSVPGEGRASLGMMFIGEAPGAKEDLLGRPFVGRSGQLLDKLLLSINISRDETFITSLVKHRPPKNRCPKPEEIEACRYWLDQQIDILNPRLIITLGRMAMLKFIKDETITKIHGKILKVKIGNREIKIMPMFHPAAGLRNPHILKMMKEDFSLIPEKLKEV